MTTVNSQQGAPHRQICLRAPSSSLTPLQAEKEAGARLLCVWGSGGRGRQRDTPSQSRVKKNSIILGQILHIVLGCMSGKAVEVI
jgi:hypothetical protein